MILVELEAGLRKQFASPSELADAIGQGAVSRNARIYHHLRQQWLPITEHPEFQRRWAERAERPVPPLERTRWTFFSVEPHEAGRPATAEMRRPGEVQAEDVSPASSTGPAKAAGPAWRRALRIAMGRLRPSRKPLTRDR